MTPHFLDFEHVPSCPGCGSASIQLRYEPDIGQCHACQLLFRNPRPTQAEIARSYDTGGTFAAWQEEETARAAMWQRRLKLVRRLRSDGKLLDVGTGDGRFLRVARDAGYAVSGTEVSEAGASYARKHGFDVQLGQLNEIDLPAETFDIITIWHVLEHVPEPRAVLRKAHSLLRPGGILAVAVPNEENLLVRKRLRVPIMNNSFGPLRFGGEIHLTYFQPRTLRAALGAAAFDLLEFGVDDLYHHRDLKMLVKRSIQRTLAHSTQWHFAVAMYAVCRKPVA